VPYTYNQIYYYAFTNLDWGQTVNWGIVAFNNDGDCATCVNRTFTVKEEPLIPANSPSAIVYMELAGYTGFDPDILILPEIDLGEGMFQPEIDFSYDEEVNNFTMFALAQDLPDYPLVKPQNCLISLGMNLPTGILTYITVRFSDAIAATELARWNGSNWIDVSFPAFADFGTTGQVTFQWLSTGRGVENFVINNGEGSTLPVELTSFTAIQVPGNNAKIQWITQSASNLLGFDLYRSEANLFEEALKINGTMIQGVNSTTISEYSYIDETVEFGSAYNYWLESIDLDGISHRYGPVRVQIVDDNVAPEIPTVTYQTEIKDIYPNPFNPSTTISFYLAQDAKIDLSVYDITGKLVRSLKVKSFYKGQTRHSLNWDGNDDNGSSVPSGVYFFKLSDGKNTGIRKSVLIK
ncbi:MAG: T9SS type A sorting domain-containing protein, partial [Candidatus Cloacimonetes bacterium]|nr:T9SS type A sorting domain-containing protein [Candidatus Cloacimonadota bacterium]